jgi:dipeptidyl aminopeptidase/acylaminoacyl peptidase
MGGGPDERPERYAIADPIALVPLPIPVLLVHGTEDATVSLRRSRNYAQAARAAGANVELVEIAGSAGAHRSHVFPSSEGFAAVLRWLAGRRGYAAETP